MGCNDHPFSVKKVFFIADPAYDSGCFEVV